MDEGDEYKWKRWKAKCEWKRCVWMKEKSVNEGYECKLKR